MKKIIAGGEQIWRPEWNMSSARFSQICLVITVYGAFRTIEPLSQQTCQMGLNVRLIVAGTSRSLCMSLKATHTWRLTRDLW